MRRITATGKMLGFGMAAVMTGAMALSAFGSYANPGTYTATAPGINGDVTLTVTFSEDAIESIEVASDETPTIGQAAMEEMVSQAVGSQTLTPDIVSGATVSGTAFRQALADAAAQAGADVTEAEAGTEAEEAGAEAVVYDVTDADVIIVGAGGAGLTAAFTAAEQGVSVIVVEKSGVVGGNSLCSQMGINAADSEIQEELGMEYATSELLKSLQMRYGGREELVDAYVAASGETVDWLAADLGINFTADQGQGEIDPDDPLAGINDAHPGGSGLFMVRADDDGYTSLTIIDALTAALTSYENVTLYVNTEATALVADDNGKVTGVKAAAADGSEVEFSGKAVLLATGGFGQNHEFVTELRPDLANAITDEMAPTTGDGIFMAEELGAKTVDLEYMQLFPHVPYGSTWLSPMSMPGGFMTTAIFVNQDAQRYTTEGFDPSVEGTLAQEKAYVIFGEEYLNDALENLMNRGIVVSADTAEELAEQLGLDGAALAETIEQWNADCEAGADSQFENTTLTKIEGKLYGYRFGVGAHYMMGGVLINENTQVLDENEEPIEGLYAAGEVTGGFHGQVRVDGSGTGDAFVFGHLAGEKIAEAVSGEA